MKSKISKIWDYIFDNLYCDKTKLIYDYIVPEYRGDFEKYLPTLDHIKAQIPNPCGWGSGMEDGMINAGVLVSAAIDAYMLEKGEKYLGYIKNLFEGMKTCASVSDSEGFLARTVSPVDGKTHYCDSSRDQYTHWIYTASKYHESSLASDEDKAFIRKTLCAFARRARKNVTAQTDWDLLREDGRRGAVVKMWNHEPVSDMRILMFYLAAWKIGGDESFEADYLAMRDDAVTVSEKVDLSDIKRYFPYNQMQLSLEFVHDYDDDETFKVRCGKLMRKLAAVALKDAVRIAEENIAEDKKAIYNGYKAVPWNQLPAWPWFGGMREGLAYYCPMNTKSVIITEASLAAWLVRDVADALLVYVKSPIASDNAAAMEALEKITFAVDLTEHTTDAPIYLLEAYYSLVKLSN